MHPFTTCFQTTIERPFIRCNMPCNHLLPSHLLEAPKRKMANQQQQHFLLFGHERWVKKRARKDTHFIYIIHAFMRGGMMMMMIYEKPDIRLSSPASILHALPLSVCDRFTFFLSFSLSLVLLKAGSRRLNGDRISWIGSSPSPSSFSSSFPQSSILSWFFVAFVVVSRRLSFSQTRKNELGGSALPQKGGGGTQERKKVKNWLEWKSCCTIHRKRWSRITLTILHPSCIHPSIHPHEIYIIKILNYINLVAHSPLHKWNGLDYSLSIWWKDDITFAEWARHERLLSSFDMQL